MASVKEGCNTHANITAAFSSHKGNHLLAVYKGLEATLNDPKKKYPDKVNALLSAWEHVTAIIATSSHEASETLIDWVHRHTLHLVLQGEWPKLSPATKTHLSVTLQRCASLLPNNHKAAPRCRTLIGLVKDPWGHPVLHRILNGASDVEDSEVLELCRAEKGILLSMRLEMLCESKCEDLALKLAEAIHRCLHSRDSCLREENGEEQFIYTIDMYIALLYKFKRIRDIIKELKHFDLKDGLMLVRRYALKDGKRARVWKNSAKVAELAAQYFLTVAMVKPVSETGTLLQELMTEWALIHSKLPSVSQTLPKMIRKLIQPAESAVHIYLFCQVLVNQFGDTLKSLCIELYIRGLTTDMNELEQQKMKNDKEKVREAEVRLSDGFLKLADLVKDNVGVCRECVLTAFSLNPTRMCFERIKEMAVASGKCLCLPSQVNAVENKEKNSEKLESVETENMDLECSSVRNERNSAIEVDTGQLLTSRFGDNVDNSNDAKTSNIARSTDDENSVFDFSIQRNRCNLHPPFDPSSGGALGELCPECGEFTGIETQSSDPTGVERKERTLDALILIKGDTVTESLNYDVLSAPNQVLDAETLGLTPQLCDDLAVVLSSPRYQMLSWVLDWAELSIMCEKYLENGEEMRNTNKELKFLNIDYNQFKDWPSGEDEKDEYYGIEKGYEQWADLSSDTSEEYYSNRSYKRRARHIHLDSDSDSSLAPRSRGRGRKVHRLDTSDSDYDSNQRKEKHKHKHYRAQSLSVSDSDTGTQDSRTDSLGSDGFRAEKPTKKEKNGRNEKTSNVKRCDQKKLKDMNPFQVIMNDDLNQGDLTSDLSNSDVMNIFSQIGENPKEVQSTQFSPMPQLNSMLNPDKRSSDPSVLKTLRMFRPHNAKNNTHLSQILHNRSKESSPRKVEEVTYSKFAPMLSTLNLNPRIVLRRADVNQDMKPNIVLPGTNRPGNPLSQITPDILSIKSNPSKALAYDVDGKTRISIPHSLVEEVKRHEYMKSSDLLAKNVPGLNSLDMIVPPPSEATVQVVQLPRNTPSTSNNNRGSSHHPPKTTHSQNLQSSGSTSGNAGQEIESTSNLSTISSQSQPPSSSAATSGDSSSQVAIATTSTQNSNTTKPVKLNSQSEVKYLTTTSEVNEILRSTLGEGSLQVHTTLQVPTSAALVKQKLSTRPEVKYRTSTEVTEILRNTLAEGIQQVQSGSSASSSHHSGASSLDFVTQNKGKLNARSDVRYLTSTSEVNEILRSTPIVQKAGHSNVSSESSTVTAGPSISSSSHQTSNSHQVGPFPVVKGVDLNIIASLIAPKSCGNSLPTSQDGSAGSSDPQMLQLVCCKGRKIQIKPIICTQSGARSIIAEHSDASTSTPSSSSSDHQQQQSQHVQVSTHSVYEEDFSGFHAPVGSPSKDKSSTNKNQKQTMSQVASLPKFQQAFGKTIYNSQSSTGVDGASHSAAVRGSEEEANSSPPTSQAASVSSTVLSKGVQTTSLSSVVSHASTPATATATAAPAPVPAPTAPPAPTPPTPAEPTSNVDIGIPSTLHLTSAGSVLSILQGSPRIAVSAALRVGAGMTVQAIQTSSGVIYMHPDTTTLVNSNTGASISARRSSGIKTSQSSDSVTPSQLSDNLQTSVAVAIASPSVPTLTRDSVKRNRMLAAALQGPHRTANQGTNTNTVQSQEPEVCVVESSSDEEVTNSTQSAQTLVTAAAVHRIMPVQKTVTRQIVQTGRNVRPVLHIPSGGNLIARSTATNIASPLRQQTVQSVLVSPVSSTSNSNVSSRMTQSVGTSESLMTHGPIEPTVSSTTLEQLREFESVLEQVTNTSQMKERSTVQPQMLTQQLLLTQATTSTTSSGMEFTSCAGSQSTTNSFSQELFPISTTTSTTSRVNVTTYVTQGSTVRTTSIVPASSVAGVNVAGKMTSPVVVVTSYCQPVASPALSVTSQSSSSPCVTPAPTASSNSSGKSPPKSSKSSKSKSVKSGTATTASKASPVPKPQQKPQEDEQTAQRIYAILDEYAEQLRNSPDLNNKPAPRRRSNPPTNSNQSSKRKKSAQTKVKLLGQQSSSTAQEMSPGADDPRTMGSEDSSSGITQLSHIQDSPAPSSQNPDDPLSLRATPSLELGSETGNLRSVVTDSGELQDVIKSEQQQSQDLSSHSREQEQSEGQQSPLQLQQTTQHGLLFADGSIQGRTVIVQDNVPNSVDGSVSGNATVVAGKPVMVGNSATVPALFAGVRQVIVPVPPGLAASVQARPVVVSSKGSKVIRVHQVTVPGGSLQMTPGMSAMQGAALVVRQINKPGIPVGTVAAPMSVLGQPTVKQVKLPVGSISSQALTGVTAQPPVVLPPGSHHLAGQVGSVVTSTIAQALSFPESSIESVLQEEAIKTEPSSVINPGETLLLNAGTSPQTIGLIRRGIPTSFHERIATSVSGVISTNASTTVPTSVTVDRVTYPSARQISSVNLDSEIVSISSSSSSNITSCITEQLKSNNESSSAHGTLTENRIGSSSAGTIQCIGVDYVSQNSLSTSNFHNRLVKEEKGIFSAKPSTGNCNLQERRDDHGGVVKSELRDGDECSGGNLVSSLKTEPVDGSDSGTSSVEQLKHSNTSCQTAQTNLLQASSSVSQRGDVSVFQTSSANQGSTNTLSEGRLFLQDRSAGSSQEVSVCLATGGQESSSHLRLMENGIQKSKPGEMPETTDSSSSSSSSSSSGGGSSTTSSSSSISSSSSSNVLHVGNKVPTTNKRRRENSPACQTSGSSEMMSKSGLLCRTNASQTLEYATSSGGGTEVATYHISSKSSNRLDFINDAAYRLPTKLSGENQDSPWRYVPVVKRVRVAIQPAMVQKDETDLATEQVGSSLNLAGRDGASEVEDGSQDRRSFLTDAKFVTVGRKPSNSLHIHPNTIHTYRKLESESEEKRRIEKMERIEMQQKMARLERELRLQKSLSEECEDLGVDEPSTSELFPEADLLLDPNSSPSFEQTMQEASCSQTVEPGENFTSSNFRHEYSSSSQEGSHHGNATIDNQASEDSENRRETRSFGSKKSYSDWKFRTTKERNKYNSPVNILRGKLNSQTDATKISPSGQSCSINNNNSSKNISSRSSSVEETRSVKPKCVTDGAETSQVRDCSDEHGLQSPSEKSTKKDASLNGDPKTALPEKSILAKTLCVSSRNMLPSMESVIEESQDSSSKQVLSSTASIANESNVPKSDLPVASSSEDSVTLDSFATSMVASSLEVTIPSPVPTTLPSTPTSHLIETSTTRDSLPTLTAAQKFAYTYGKKPTSCRQDVCRVIKRARLNRPNQYFNDHIDSQETWDSSSSQDKTGADDEDSEEMSPSSQVSSQLDDGANTDVDVVEISNDESSSALSTAHSPAFPLLPNVCKVSALNPQTKEGTLKLSSTNGMDSVDGKSAMNSGKRIPIKRSRAGSEKHYMGGKTKSGSARDGDSFDETVLLSERRLKTVTPASKLNVPTKETSAVVSPPIDSNYRKQQGIRARLRGGRDSCEDVSVDAFPLLLTPSSMTDTIPSPEGDDGTVEEHTLKMRLEGKDECPIGGTCETHLKPTRSSRRRGHIKMCQCCNGSPERPKKKKVEKTMKKGQPTKQIGKTSITKKSPVLKRCAVFIVNSKLILSFEN